MCTALAKDLAVSMKVRVQMAVCVLLGSLENVNMEDKVFSTC